MEADEILSLSEARAAQEQSSDESDPESNSAEILRCLADNEVGDARLFKSLNERKFVFDHSAALWHIWAGNFWLEDIKYNVLDAGIDVVVNEYAIESQRQAWNATKEAKAGRTDVAKHHEKLRKKLLQRITALQEVRRRRNVLVLASAGAGLVGNEWDRLSMVLACQNGVIDLKTGRCRPGRQEDYLKTASPTEWTGIDAPCPTWDRFLIDTFDGDIDLVSFVQRLFGYSLTGTCEQHLLPIFYGEGRNGKSTLLETLKTVLGAYVLKSESELLLTQKQPRQAGAPNSAVCWGCAVSGSFLPAKVMRAANLLQVGSRKWLAVTP